MRWLGGWCRQTMVAAAREENRVARISGGEGGDSDEVEALGLGLGYILCSQLADYSTGPKADRNAQREATS